LHFAFCILHSSACTSNHHVSPFGDIDPSELLRPQRDLEGQLARVEREAKAQGLTEKLRIRGQLPSGEPFLALGLAGTDVVGRAIQATRVVTPSGIVLAEGPPDSRSAVGAPHILLPSLAEGGAFPSGQDLNGDGSPDVVLRAADGTLAVYRIDALGAARYPVVLAFPPTRVLDVNGDGRADLAGTAPIASDDPFAPELLDVAVATPSAYRNDDPAAVAFHAARREKARAPSTSPPAVKLRRAIERAFHGIRAGIAANDAIQEASDEAARLAPLPEPLAASWVKWRGLLADRAPTWGKVSP
jgi:hypothetical protein